jgi:PAS domain S-box-containing protein
MLDKLLLFLNDYAWAYSLTEKRYLFISPNIEQELGVTPTELSADPRALQNKIIEADRELIAKKCAELKLEDQFEMHYRMVVGDKIKWMVEKRTHFIDWASNNEIILAVIKDVSDQAVVKHHLANALGDFSVLFEKSKSPMWIYETPSLRILKVNNAAIEHYGYSNAEFLDMTIRDVRPKIDLAAFNEYIFRKGITKGKKLGQNSGGIWRHQNKQGEIIYAEITGYEMKYNNTSCRVIIASDVTDRVLFEQERDRVNSLENSN